MTVTVNGEPRSLHDGATVADVVADMGRDGGRGLAVAVNGEVVARSRWPDTRLTENDRIEVLEAIGGG